LFVVFWFFLSFSSLFCIFLVRWFDLPLGEADMDELKLQAERRSTAGQTA
jgi:hypothetical protein